MGFTFFSYAVWLYSASNCCLGWLWLIPDVLAEHACCASLHRRHQQWASAQRIQTHRSPESTPRVSISDSWRFHPNVMSFFMVMDATSLVLLVLYHVWERNAINAGSVFMALFILAHFCVLSTRHYRIWLVSRRSDRLYQIVVSRNFLFGGCRPRVRVAFKRLYWPALVSMGSQHRTESYAPLKWCRCRRSGRRPPELNDDDSKQVSWYLELTYNSESMNHVPPSSRMVPVQALTFSPRCALFFFSMQSAVMAPILAWDGEVKQKNRSHRCRWTRLPGCLQDSQATQVVFYAQVAAYLCVLDYENWCLAFPAVREAGVPCSTAPHVPPRIHVQPFCFSTTLDLPFSAAEIRHVVHSLSSLIWNTEEQQTRASSWSAKEHRVHVEWKSSDPWSRTSGFPILTSSR